MKLWISVYCDDGKITVEPKENPEEDSCIVYYAKPRKGAVSFVVVFLDKETGKLSALPALFSREQLVWIRQDSAVMRATKGAKLFIVEVKDFSPG